jgi:hypothetical protein
MVYLLRVRSINHKIPGDYQILLNMAYCSESLNDIDAAEKYYRASAKAEYHPPRKEMLMLFS